MWCNFLIWLCGVMVLLTMGHSRVHYQTNALTSFLPFFGCFCKLMCGSVILGYKTYVVLDATRSISAATLDAAMTAMKNSGTYAHAFLHADAKNIFLFCFRHSDNNFDQTHSAIGIFYTSDISVSSKENFSLSNQNNDYAVTMECFIECTMSNWVTFCLFSFFPLYLKTALFCR